MRSVPHRGSGWVLLCNFSRFVLCTWSIARRTHPLPRGVYPQLTLWSITCRRFYNHRWNVLLTHQLIDSRHIRLHSLRELLQLRVYLPDHIVINYVRLRIRSCFGAAHNATKRSQLVVKTNREVQRILAALVLSL